MAEKSRQGINIRVCTKTPLLGEKAGPLLDNVGKREEQDLGDPRLEAKKRVTKCQRETYELKKSGYIFSENLEYRANCKCSPMQTFLK